MKGKVMNVSVELTKNLLRVRLKDPRQFKKLRTDDIGRKGHSLRLAGLNRKTGKWETQAWLVSRKDLEKRDRKAWNLVNKINQSVSKTKQRQIILKLRMLG